MDNKLIVLCGLQGSGKSTYANEMVNVQTDVILSSDEYRKHFPEYDNDKIFKTLYNDMNDNLQKGKNVIVDATNITIKSRKKLLDNLTNKNIKKEIIVFATPIETCRERLNKRNQDKNSHYVPLEVLENYHKSFEVPFKEEGWNNIEVICKPNYINVEKAKELMIDFEQNSPYHKFTLWEHSLKVSDYVLKNATRLDIISGAILHDVGKLWTKVPNKKDPNISSYYGHQNVGAYWKLCNGLSLESAFYENYHMMPYDWKTEKAKAKWKAIFGEEKYKCLMLLHEADKLAH